MKFSQYYNIFVTACLALVCLSSVASSKDLSHLPEAASFVAKRRLDDGGGFDLGQWAGDLWDSVTGKVDDTDEGEEAAASDSGDDLGEWVGNLWDSIAGGDSEDEEGSSNNNNDLDFDLNFCSLVEAAIGMGESFGSTANCTCDGDWDSGLTLGCNFDECAPNSEVCGKVGIEYTFGGIDGPVDMTACADFQDDQYQETCFSYQFEMNDGLEQTCEATYGGQACDCQIENGLCLKVDCSRFVPGATIDTCQALSMTNAGDTQNFFPDFEIFQPDFQLQAENVPWERLDFENLDFDNFDVAALEWGDFLNNDNTWMDLIGENPTFLDSEGLSAGVCTLMYQAANLSQGLGMESSCTCGYDKTKGALELTCDFEETCTSQDDPLCGAVSMNLTYVNLREISANVCIRYLDFPETCYSYGVPFVEEGLPGNNNSNNNNIVGDLTQPGFFRDCSARYGQLDNNCKCTIDANNCLKVDCGEFEPLAVTDECQVVDLNNIVEDPSKVVLNFKTPALEDVVSDGAGGEFVALESAKSGGSSTTTHGVTLALASTALLVVAGQVW